MPYLSPNEPLTLTELATLLRSKEAVRLSPEAEQTLAATPLLAEPELAATSPARWSAGLLTALAAGTGPELPAVLVRRMLLLAAHRLGRTGGAAALPTVRRLLDFYSREVWPLVYEQGSLGAGNDQIPLAQLALPLAGLGEVNYQGYRLAAADVLGLFGWEPPQLSPALALGLLSGSAFTLAHATEALERAEHLLRAAEAVGSLAATGPAPAPSLGLLTDARQVIEAACNTTASVPTSLAELLPATSSPTLALDHALAQLTQAVAQVGARAAQRTAELVASPRHLAAEPEQQFGLLALPRAAASLVQQCGSWAISGDSHLALSGAAAAQEARRVMELAEQLVGLELLAATQALALREQAGDDLGRTFGPELGRVVAAFREHVTFAAHDRVLAPDLHRAARFVREYAWAQE
jgi:histidine ammonia-lyase